MGLGNAFGQNGSPGYDAGVDALYNLDFPNARQTFEKLAAQSPENPTHWNALATTQWLDIVYSQEKLNLESFSGSSLGTRDSKESVSAADEKKFRDTVATAIAKADAILKKHPKDRDALYAKGVSLGALGAFEAVVKRSYLRAHGKAKEARSLHLEVLKLDPSFKDAKMAVGVYEYTVGAIPGWLRFFLGVFGVGGGSKENGVAALEDAAKNGRRVSTDAKMLLVVVYNRERRFDEALKILDDLQKRYPRNFLFELASASTLGKMQRRDDALRVYGNVVGKAEAQQDGYDRLSVPKILNLEARAAIDAKQFDHAIRSYNRVTHHSSASDNDKAIAHLWLGKIYDSSNRRQEAVREYESVLRLKTTPEHRREAERYRKDPWRGE